MPAPLWLRPFHRAVALIFLSCSAMLVSCYSEKELAEQELTKRAIPLTSASVHQQAAAGSVENLTLLKSAGLSLVDPDSEGKSPLFHAIVHDSGAAAFEFLLQHTPDETIDHPDKTGRTALSHAVENDKQRATLTPQLLQRGANPEKTRGHSVLNTLLEENAPDLALAAIAPCPEGSPLFTAAMQIAVEQNYPAVVSALLAKQAPANLFLNDATTLLYKAYSTGKTEIVNLLLDHGAVCPEPGLNGMENILTIAAERKDEAMIRRFLTAGANPQQVGPGGKSCTEVAVKSGNLPILDILLTHGGRADSLFINAVHEANRPLIDVFVKHPLDLNLKDMPGNTALHYAVEAGDAALVATLLSKGSPWDSAGRIGQSAFSLAVVSGNLSMVESFLKRGADPNSDYFINWLKKDEGLSPLMHAAARGDLPMIRALLDAGAKRGQKTKKWKRFPVNFACELEEIQAAQALLGRKPNDDRNVKIIISLSTQKATVYQDGKEIRSTKVSTGRSGFPTPRGRYVISDKQASWTSTIYKVSMPYFMRLSGKDFGLHQGIVTGRPASHGCIRLPAGTARELFALMKIGDPVEIH
jgi:ankyrin repeat protein